MSNFIFLAQTNDQIHSSFRKIIDNKRVAKYSLYSMYSIDFNRVKRNYDVVFSHIEFWKAETKIKNGGMIPE